MRTILYDHHVALGAKMGDFAGWEMPIFYSSIISEHLAVRKAVGLFDVCHMGRVDIRGAKAEAFLDSLSTNVITDRPNGSATYTVFSSERGGCVDDCIIFRINAKHFFLIVNASNRQQDLEHLKHYASAFQVAVEPFYEGNGILALQGPLSTGLLQRLLEQKILLKTMQFNAVKYENEEFFISRTGYTGSLGYELIGSAELILKLWQALLRLGKDEGIEPAGLGARDTLRLEAGYALYGHELALNIAPTESISEWTVRWKKAKFLGKEALIKLQTSSKKRSQYAVILSNRSVARQNCPVYKGVKAIGMVTSGGYSPSLRKSIAIIMVNANLAFGEQVEIEIRGQRHSAQVVKLPFYKG